MALCVASSRRKAVSLWTPDGGHPLLCHLTALVEETLCRGPTYAAMTCAGSQLGCHKQLLLVGLRDKQRLLERTH